MRKLLDFLNKLEENKIYYKLGKVRDCIMVEIAVPGQRWEVEFFDDGRIEIEKFVSQGMTDETQIDTLFELFSD